MKYFLFGVSAYFLSLPTGLGEDLSQLARLCLVICEKISAGPTTY